MVRKLLIYLGRQRWCRQRFVTAVGKKAGNAVKDSRWKGSQARSSATPAETNMFHNIPYANCGTRIGLPTLRIIKAPPGAALIFGPFLSPNPMRCAVTSKVRNLPARDLVSERLDTPTDLSEEAVREIS